MSNSGKLSKLSNWEAESGSETEVGSWESRIVKSLGQWLLI
jgi:hypothetical protein